MCGITGILSACPSDSELDLAGRMMDQLKHRGPDDSGIYHSGHATLGFRRLSIIDLELGHQPMVSHDSRYAMVFNGEIYNFRELRLELESDHDRHFFTHSDSEVLLQAFEVWGPDCFVRLNGMFAIAIWDNVSNELFLARDRSGKKPLFTFAAQGQFCFASEVKVFFAHPAFSAQPDPARIAAGLAYRYVPGTETLFQGVDVIPAGHWAVVKAGEPDVVTVQPYWNYKQTNRRPAAAKSAEAATDELRQRLSRSVIRRLVADVPVGTFLSGGIDSSVITALMATNTSQPVSTFSIGFDTGFSEHNFARKVAEQFGTNHHELIVSADDLLKLIPAVLWHRETPISEPSDIPLYMLSREARKHVTVVLSGEGSDELFGGYPKYIAEHYLERFPSRSVRKLFPLSARMMSHNLSGSSPVSLALASMSEADEFDSMARWFGAFGSVERRKFIRSDSNVSSADPHEFARRLVTDLPGMQRVEAMQILDHAHWLPANLLLRGDRVTMAHSLELRCPFLDPEVIDLAFHELPDKFKVRNGTGKWLLRDMARGLLPPQITERKKWGFKVPVGEWFRGPLKDVLMDTLLSRQAINRGYFNENEIRRLITGHLEHGANHSKQLWYLFQLELWHLMFIDGTLKPSDSLV